GVLGALHLVLALLAFQPAPHAGGDNAVYLSLARSLAAGEGYRDAWDPAMPPHAQFPPGYPALLAAALRLGVAPWAGIKGVTVALSVAGVVLTFFWIRRRRRPDLALGVALLAALSPGVVALSHWELSDVPFWALTTAALLAWERLPRRRNGRLAAGALLAAAAYLVRSAGLPLMVAAAAWLLFRRRWAQLGLYALVVLPAAAAWWLWARGRGEYDDFLRLADPYNPSAGTIGTLGLIGRAGENLRLYAGEHLPVLLTGSAGPLAILIAVCVIALALYGWLRRARRPGVAEVFLPLYVGMLLLWTPAWSGDRLLLPVFPAVLMYAGDGLARLARLARMPHRALSMSAVAVLALAALPGLAAAAREGTECTRWYLAGDRYGCMRGEWQDFLEMAAVSKRVLPDGAVVISRKPAIFFVESGLRGRNYPLARDPAAFFAEAEAAGARYVVLDYIDQVALGYLTPILMRRPQAFCVMHSLGAERTTLLGIRPGAARLPDLRGDPGSAEMDVAFQACGPELWRSPAARASLSAP
ncbi:MAG TPA: hypothetical protein VHG91_16165, partial [Longimicrobium sp.]|nr:hypothetical protein [Longimicrobium sp.]